MLLSMALLLLVSIIPGFALLRILDASSDYFRKFLLTPALGLLLIYGLNGLLLLLSIWSVFSVTLCLIILNVLSVLHIKSSKDEDLSQWMVLELAMKDDLISLSDKEIAAEVAAQKWFQANRVTWKTILALIICFSVLLIPILQNLPFGVDWVGFSVLSGQVAIEQNLNLSGTNNGYWTYPPAFPALSAYIASILQIDSAIAVFQLGHYSLFTIMLGVWGAMDRNGAGAESVFAMTLALGIFAKTFDSGYPTVASQLGLVVGLLVLLRQYSGEIKHHTRAFVVSVICVALIHPTGAIYLGLMMLAHIVIRLTDTQSIGNSVRKLLIASSVLLLLAAIIALFIIAPRLLDSAVFAEYGWQGGRPLLFYNGILLMFGFVAAYRLRDFVEIRLLTIWISLLWLLTAIHLIEGFDKIPLLSLLSYTLYSMSIHAFHIPLAALVALWLSPTTNLKNDDGSNGILTFAWNPHLNQKIVSVIIASLMLAFSAGLSVMIEMSQHQELRPVSNSDLQLRESLNDLPSGSIVYSENAHWGHIWDAPTHIKMTSMPTLGLVELEDSIQSQVTNAIKNDAIETLTGLAITHAITSPRGVMQFYLAQSQYWQVIENIDSSKLWQFVEAGNQSQSEFIALEQKNCISSCQQRVDTWAAEKYLNPISLAQKRIYIQQGDDLQLQIDLENQGQSFAAKDEPLSFCMLVERIGITDSVVTAISYDEVEIKSNILRGNGFVEDCFLVEDGQSSISLHYSIDWPATSSSNLWLNPTGLSGRGDVIFDHTGLIIHWLELS